MRTLQLNPAKVATAADFFEAYARYALTRDPVSEDSDEVSPAYLLDAASSLHTAGQWAMLFDPRRAARLLAEAARIWQNLDYGFGTFVLAAVAPGDLERDSLNNRLQQMAQQYIQVQDITGRVRRRIRPQQIPEPMRHPQQQAYLLLGCASLWRRFDLEPGLLRLIVEQSPHRRGVAPIGALGMPLRQYWDIAGRFLDASDDETARTVAADLARMADVYAEAINSAMANERLWFNAAAPVDVGDIDITVIALISARRLGRDLTQEHLRSATESLGPTARVPLELAGEMIDNVFPDPGAQTSAL
jgi:hypothetical protein